MDTVYTVAEFLQILRTTCSSEISLQSLYDTIRKKGFDNDGQAIRLTRAQMDAIRSYYHKKYVSD
jgi:hypothetical protein